MTSISRLLFQPSTQYRHSAQADKTLSPCWPSLDQHQWTNHSQPSLDQHQWTHSNNTGSDSPLYLSGLYHHVGHHISGLALLKLMLILSLCRPSLDQHQWTHRSTRAASTTCRPSLDQLSVDSLLYSSCLYHHVSHHWISISGLTDAFTTMSTITGSASVDSPLYLSCLYHLLACQRTHHYLSCLYHHVSHHWISVSGLTALLELPLPPCRPSLDQCQRTQLSTRAASTTMSAIIGSVSVDSPLYLSCLYHLSAIAGSASVDSLLYSS